MPISIFPPTLASTQPAFLATEPTYRIYFTLQSITSVNEVRHVQVRIAYNNDNSRLVGNAPDGIIYKTTYDVANEKTLLPYDSVTKQYYIELSSSDFAATEGWWKTTQLYKIQLRFGTAVYNTSIPFATWKQTQIDNNAFSEWSTVMVVKPIGPVRALIENNPKDRGDSQVVRRENTEATTMPLFVGRHTTDDNEPVTYFKFDLYVPGSDEVLESSGWVTHSNQDGNNRDKYRFKNRLNTNESYTVVYSVRTKNLYEISSDDYDFKVAETYIGDLKNVTLTIHDDTEYCRNNGCIQIYCVAPEGLTGNYVITRASEKSGFQIYEELCYQLYDRKILDGESPIYTDFTIESGVRYKYAFQQENSNGLRTAPLTVIHNPSFSVDFECAYLYRNGVQLKLTFDQTLNSFKHTTLRTKLDTIGNRYPHLVQNGEANYAEFPLNGLISFHMDDDNTFLRSTADGYYCGDELVIPSDKFDLDTRIRGDTLNKDLVIDTNLTANNVFIERIFREKVEEFLNDFKPKLYRSPTEGNIVIGLLNVSLTPKQELGRMIFSFTANAYEIADSELESLQDCGITTIGKYTSWSSEDTNISFGQVSGIYGSNVDIFAMIRQQEEVSLDDGFMSNLIELTSIWVEQYPQVGLLAKELELEALYADALNRGDKEEAARLLAEIATVRALKQALEGPTSFVTRLRVNGAEVIVRPNQIYHLEQPITSLSLQAAVAPIIMNYTCKLSKKPDSKVGVVSAVESSKIWGQISGVFTGTNRILRSYDYDWRASKTYRIFNPEPAANATIIRDANNNILVDATNYNVYDTVNLYDIIKEETQKQVELIYKTKFEERDGLLTNGSIYYRFGYLNYIDIEADVGTVLYIGRSADDCEEITMARGIYAIKDIVNDDQVQYIALRDPQYCVINFRCYTNQEIRTGVSGS